MITQAANQSMKRSHVLYWKHMLIGIMNVCVLQLLQL